LNGVDECFTVATSKELKGSNESGLYTRAILATQPRGVHQAFLLGTCVLCGTR